MSTISTYPCHGVHKSLPKGRASGKLTISETQLIFKIQDKTVCLFLTGLTLTLGGASNRLVFLSHPSQPEWRFYTSDLTLLKNITLKNVPHLKNSIKKAQQKRGLNWALLAVVAALCLLVPLGLLSNMDLASKSIAKQVPSEWESDLGELSFKQYTLQAQLMDEEKTQPLLDPLISPLLSAINDERYQYQFYIANNSELNAFALPGGVVVINSGLILAADSADEVLGVVAHEITHVQQQHGLRNVISSAGTYVLLSALLGDVSGLLGMVADSAPLLINQGYSRQFETQADELGFELLVAANIDPKGLASFFKKLLKKEQEMLEKLGADEQQNLISIGFEFLSSHPATQARVDKLTKNALKISKKPLDLNQEFMQLKNAVIEFVSEIEQSEDSRK